MNFILTLILLLLILGVLVSIHEFGHFTAAKKAGVYVYEFCLGMGPKLFGFKRKNDETLYTLRLFPVGGFVAMASDVDPKLKLKDNQILQNKKYWQKLVVLSAGIIMNLLLALVILFVSGLIFGSPETRPIIGKVAKGYPAYSAGLRENDLILKLDNKKVTSWDDISLALNVKDVKSKYEFIVKRDNGEVESVFVSPKKEKVDDQERYVFGISSSMHREYGFIEALKYTGNKFSSMISSMVNIFNKLFTGKIGMDKLSGPVGMFSVVDNMKASGIENVLFLVAFLSVNVGFINIIPIPVFDGGRILLATIEKIKGSRISPRIESSLNLFGFFMLMFLMVYVTWNDIIRLLKL